MPALERRDGVVYSGLALNERGYDRLRATGLDEVSFAVAATETFSERNAGASVEAALDDAERIVERAKGDGLHASVTVSVAFGCPFEGPVDPQRVLAIGERLAATGGGRARPRGHDRGRDADAGQRARRGIRAARQARRRPLPQHAQHRLRERVRRARCWCHRARRVRRRLGGCPFAPKATRNVATEDLAYLLEGEGVETGVDLEALIGISEWLEELLGRRLEGYLYRAGLFRSQL